MQSAAEATSREGVDQAVGGGLRGRKTEEYPVEENVISNLNLSTGRTLLEAYLLAD